VPPLKADIKVLVHLRELEGLCIYIVDGMFQPAFVQILYSILRNLPFSLSDYDNPETKDLLHWKYDFALDSFAANPVYRNWHDNIVAKTNELFPNHHWKLLRVYCNNSSYGDHQHAHVDNEDTIPGVTSLYFANAEWHDNWHGEILLYDRRDEPFYAVAPKPGRVLIFPGNIMHRGGVPSRACFEPRLSVPFKFISSG
jgi:hypothetical protein